MAEKDLLWMSAVVFIPSVFALLLIFVPRGKEDIMRWLSLAGTGLTLGVSIAMFILFYNNVIDFNRGGDSSNRERVTLDYRLTQIEKEGIADKSKDTDWLSSYPWIDRFNINYYLGADGISMPLVLLTTVLSFLAMIASWKIERLAESGLAEAAFNCITSQIEQAGLVLKKGTLIDASLVPAAVNKPAPPEEDLPPDADGRPGSKLVRSPLDPDAAWTKKDGRRHFGYKAHVALDTGSRIVRRAMLTPANVNETSCADDLICGDERAVYADKAYDSKERSAALKARGIRNRIMRRWHWRWPPPSRWQQRRNALLVIRRAPIEPLFALLKAVYRFSRARYRGLVRNAGALQLAVTAMNIKRWTILTQPA